MFNTTTTIGPLQQMPLFIGLYSNFKFMIFIQAIAALQRFLVQLNLELERIKNLTAYIRTHIISIRRKFISLNEIFNKNYSYSQCNRSHLLNSNNDNNKIVSVKKTGMTIFGFNFFEFNAIASLDGASKGPIKYLKVSF